MVFLSKDKKLSKILIVLSNPAVGGTETFIITISSVFQKEGIGVDILNTWSDAKLKNMAVARQLNYRELTGNRYFPSIKNIKLIAGQIKNDNYQLIMSFGFRINILLRFLRIVKPQLRKKPLIVGLRGLDKWRKWYHLAINQLTEFSCDLFVPNSEAVARLRMRREKTPAKKIVIIRNGVDVSYFDRGNCVGTNRSQLGLPTDKILITTVGNFRYQKGHDFLLRVIKKFSSSILENVHFVWAGEGPLKETLEKQIKQLGLTEKISILGWTNDVRQLLACSDILALPSREESMPRCLMEAMSMGLPCVATNVGGTAEVIENEKNGFLSDFDNIQVFGNCLKKLIDSPELRREIGIAARKRIVDNFSIEIIAKKYIRLFELVCSGEHDGQKIQDILDAEFKTKTKKTRIFHILSNPSIGGIEVMLTNLIPQMNSQQCEMKIINLRTKSEAYAIWNNADIKYYAMNTPGKFPVQDILRLAGLLRDEYADIVEIHGIRANFIGRLAAKLAGVPIILTSVLSTDDWRKWYHVWLDRSTSWAVTGWIANSNACKRSLVEREHFPANKISVLYDGIVIEDWTRFSDNTTRLRYRAEWGYNEENVIFVTVANFRPDKGLQYLIEAIPLVLKKNPHARFVLVGSDWMGGQLQKRSEELNIKHAIHFMGFRRDIKEIYDAADGTILPSLREGLPICLIEAMSMELPVVATSVSGIPELVADGLSGLLVAPRDLDNLAKAISQMALDKTVRQEMGHHGRLRVQKMFAIEDMIKNLENYYQICVRLANRPH